MSQEIDQPQNPETEKRHQRSYSDDDKYLALCAVRNNGGNVHRTAIGLGIPSATLAMWVKQFERGELPLSENPVKKERRGDLSEKLEAVAHDIIESITPEVIQKATLSQRGVFLGIVLDKTRVLRAQGLEPDPVTELCKLLNIHPSQLPDRFELPPNYKLPSGFLQGATIIDAEPQSPEPSKIPVISPVSPPEAPEPSQDSDLLNALSDDDESN